MTQITAAGYQFLRLDHLPEMRAKIRARCQELGLMGTVLLAQEGINFFISGEPENVRSLVSTLQSEFSIDRLCYKENPCDFPPFKRLLVKIKKEIISLGDPSIDPTRFTAPYLSPEELKTWFDEKKDFVVLDTRNVYEIECGKFENTIHLGLDTFREINQASKTLPEELKDKTVVTVCTGGIRCEKASALFLNLGFQKVYQLEGGILEYFKRCQGDHYEGTCFVFDWRLAVDRDLNPHPRSSPDTLSAGRHKIIQ